MQLCTFSKAVVQLLAGSPDNRNNNDAIDLCSLVGLLVTQTAMAYPKSHLKLNQVNLPSLAIEANGKTSANSIFNLTAKRSTTEVRFLKGWC